MPQDEVQIKSKVSLQFNKPGQLGPTLKNCWFAVLLPTHQNWPYPKNYFVILRDFFFLKNPGQVQRQALLYCHQNCIFNDTDNVVLTLI